MNTSELNTMNTQVQQFIKQIEERGIVCGQQSTYFGDKIYVHIYGNNQRAAIYSPSQFLRWADWYLNHHTEGDECQDEDVSLGGTGIQVVSI